MEKYVFCSRCNMEITEDEQYLMEDECFCEDCYEDRTVTCSSCGGRIWNDDNEGDSDVPLCVRCYDANYTTCSRCEHIIANDDAYYAEDDDDSDYPYCYHYFERYERNTYLHSYSYKPEPIFYGDGKRFFGVELEIDDAGKNECNAKKLCEVGNSSDKYIYIKTDSGLGDDLEIVTHPMSLDYH